MNHLFPLLLYFDCTLRPYLTRLAASFHIISTGATVAVTKLDLQYGVAHSSHVVLVTCVRNLYTSRTTSGTGTTYDRVSPACSILQERPVGLGQHTTE